MSFEVVGLRLNSETSKSKDFDSHQKSQDF